VGQVAADLLARLGLKPNRLSGAGGHDLRSSERIYNAVMDGEPEHLSQDHRCSMKSTMGSAGELHDIHRCPARRNMQELNVQHYQ
jgi:hypothetical protein